MAANNGGGGSSQAGIPGLHECDDLLACIGLKQVDGLGPIPMGIGRLEPLKGFASGALFDASQSQRLRQQIWPGIPGIGF
jgi:hypothetical protein